MSKIRYLTLAACLFLPTATVLAGPEPPSSSPPAEKGIQLGAHLGVLVVPVPPPLAAQIPATVAPGQGVMVMGIQPGSPAAEAGLRRFDVLTSYDDQRLFSPEQLSSLTRLDRPGREVSLQVARAGSVMTLTVTLGEGAPGPTSQKHWRGHPHHHPHVTPRLQKQSKSRFSTFQAMSVERLEDDRYRAKIKYQGPDGERHEHAFEGSREEVRQQIMTDKDLATPAKRQLLKALGISRHKSTWHPRSYPDPHPRLHDSVRHFREKMRQHCEQH